MTIVAALTEHALPFMTGLLVGVVGVALIGGSVALYRRKKRNPTVGDRLGRHFAPASGDQIEVQTKEFPYRVSVDAYRCLQAWIRDNATVDSTMGIPIVSSFMESTGIASLLAPSSDALYPSAIEYDSFDVGEDAPVQCVKHSLWLLDCDGIKIGLLWTSTLTHSGCGFQTKLRIDLAYARGEAANRRVEHFLAHLEDGIQRATTYRGKILSLEDASDYRGNAGGIVVHRLRGVHREDVILPDSTIRLLERNVVRFIDQRTELRKLGIPTKKGLLFYGPPGTGKTHTIHYLVGALQGHTTLLITGDQTGQLDEYISLARLLQPSVVVIEDVDLIGREREGHSTGRESLLNKLLNEMDGLRPDADILFLLTTNKPEALEKALAARPGRIDQAIEFPLPDEGGRRKLIRLYAAGARISDEIVHQTARTTHGVSASFIKELMRRAIQFHLECRSRDGEIIVLQNDVDQAIEELLYIGGSLNRALLGAEGPEVEEFNE